MDNKRIASILNDISVYKDLNGENPFKVKAFSQAARTLEKLDISAEELVNKDKLTDIKGIGKQIESVVREIVKTGESSLLKELKKSFPDTIEELFKIPGMGPKKVRAVWEKLGVASLGELEYACIENRLVSLDGFGQKSQDKILKAIEFVRQNSEMHLFPEVELIAGEVTDELKNSGMFKRIDIAGSLRRGKTVFKDIDILLVPDEKYFKDSALSETVREKVKSLADSQDSIGIIGVGETKISIRRYGLQIDFRLVKDLSYPSALQHFTGSREHNALLRRRAKGLGFKMNEYGVFSGDKRLSLKTEAEVYESLNLKWIPPEIREGFGEIEASENNALPALVEINDIRGMVHAHSTYSDGSSGIKELAEACVDLGYSYLCLSDHSRSAFYAGGLSEMDILRQIEEIRGINLEFSPFKIFCGIESDILPNGDLDYSNEILGKLDFVIGSIHSRLNMGEKDATERLLRAINNPNLTILGHISGRLLLSREGYPYNEEEILTAIKDNEVVLEHNCNPHRLDPDWEVLKRAKERGILISLDTDAHSIEGFSDIQYGVKMAKKAWLGRTDILNCKDTEAIDEFFRGRKKRKGIKDI
ncbi:MAG: DNA polymerase/3'-5' exonuclease PolX [Spirochaetales bacterium]|nr:DNA polymerase/3'-5' exonuclease PolX [Spirochaetales bacterium]